ncbi:Vesicular-fusion protein sec18 like [Verticillium longisporum]|nr:Vesicular-fusion protein sec18 like [Verticillium longisporum]
MSRAPPFGQGRMGLPGANPRAVPSRDQPPRESYGQQPQGSYGGSHGGSGQGYGGQGYGGQGGYGQPQRSPGMPSNYEKSPMSPPRGGGGGGGRQVPLTVGKVQDKTMQSHLIYHNKCAVSPMDFPPNRDGSDLYILIRGGEPLGEYVVSAEPVDGFPPGTISLSDPQRTWCRIGMMDRFTGEIYDPFSQGSQAYLGSLDVEVSFASVKKTSAQAYDEDDLVPRFLKTYQNQILSPGERILMDVNNVPLMIVVKTVGLVDLGMSTEAAGAAASREPRSRGIITPETKVNFFKAPGAEINLKASAHRANTNSIIAPDFKFEDMGIGGLGEEFGTIFRRAFASRVFPPRLVEKLGIQHVKGILLFGPPGTGKTLIARQIGKMLNARPPKIINGPEVLNKYVGASEENVRKMFADAEKEYKEKGDESGLHIIIFDELDAVCKQRGSGAGGGTGVGDSVVNQLLTKLDGVDQLNNILLIGMTNRKDMIDEALLRPGRLEVQLEIGLPDEDGRKEILMIHTNKMRENDIMDDSVDVQALAAQTKNYSGAEIAGVVKAATSFAFNRHTEVGEMAKMKSDVASMKIKMEDFLAALTEVKPAYGVSEDDLANSIKMGIITYSRHIEDIIRTGMGYVNTLKEGQVLDRMSVLFHGPAESGKTAIASHIAMLSEYPFVKLVSPQNLTPFRDEFGKKDYLSKVFADAYKSPLSIVILDNFEQLIEWNPIGPRFSNTILDRLTSLIQSAPPKGRRLLVFVTTSELNVLKMLGVMKLFRRQIPVPAVSTLRELESLLNQTNNFDSADINHIVNTISQDTGSQQVGIGIKTVLECLEESRVEAARGEANMVESFTGRIVSAIGSNLGSE